jgi:hypothetical protein
MVMPWSDDVYFFEPGDFYKLFRKAVLKAMVDNPPPLPSGPPERRDREVLLQHAGTKRPFPRRTIADHCCDSNEPEFSVAYLGVPLYAIDYAEATGCGDANGAYAAAVSRWRRDHPDGSLKDHVRGVS